MATDMFKTRVLFGDGEGVNPDDLNNVGSYIATQVYDQLLQHLVGQYWPDSAVRDFDFGAANTTYSGSVDRMTPGHLAITPHGGQAYLVPGTANNKVSIANGVLFQKTATSDGDTPTMLPFYFAHGGTVATPEWTIAAGHATLPRVDLLQMKLELIEDDSTSVDFEDAVTGAVTTTTYDKTVRVQCTLSVKSGTAATDPLYPDPDAGYCAVGAVVVGPAYLTSTAINFTGKDTSGATASVHDQRMPMNVQGYHVFNTGYWLVTNYNNTSSVKLATSTNASNLLQIPCPKGGRTGRLVGIHMDYTTTGTVPTTTLVGANGPSATTYTLCSLILTAAGSMAGYVYAMKELEGGADNTALGYYVQESATNKIGPPIWTGGYRNPQPLYLGTRDQRTMYLNIANAANGATFSQTTWYIAEGI
jgi:hypothetical protein